MAPKVRPPCTRPNARSRVGERRGRNTGRVAGPQSRKLPETPGAGATKREKGPWVPQPGAPSLCARSELRLHPAAALGANALEIAVEEAAEPVIDRPEQPARDEDPRLRDRIAIRVHDAPRLAVANQVGEEA